MITDDPGTSSYSPYFAGRRCIHCDKKEDLNEKGECENCATSECFLCETTVNIKKLRSVKDKQVCTECIDYEGIQVVRDLILRINLKNERSRRVEIEKRLIHQY